MNEIFDDAAPLRELFHKSIAKAVEAERERWTTILTMAKDAANDNADCSHSVRFAVVKTLRACRDAGVSPLSEPESPAPEPMTVEKVLEALRHFAIVTTDTTWELIETDLQALVREQARKDAAIAASSNYGGRILAADILRAAGLE